MNISEKRYPYPVLTPNGDDYEGSSFDVAIEVVKSPEKVSVKFIPTLKDNGLKRLIGSEQAAKIICHVESPKTVFRTCVELKLPLLETAEGDECVVKDFPAAELSGTVSVCPFIVATKDIPVYTNESFNCDYEGESFAIETGAVMAEGRQKTFVVDTAKEALVTGTSSFIVVTGPSDCKTLRVDYEGERIKVYMPKIMKQQYYTLKDTPEDREAIWAMVFVPALVCVLADLAAARRYKDEEALRTYSELRWFRAVDHALRTRFGFGVDSKQFEESDCLEMASLIVKNCVKGALKTMTSGYLNGDDE